MQKSAPEEIRQAATDCRHVHLDTQILTSDNLIADFVRSMCDPNSPNLFMDIPLTAIVGTQHTNFDPLGLARRPSDPKLTWREAVQQKGLELKDHKGEDWKHDVFEYFENAIDLKPFPPNPTASTLELQCLAGAVWCTNGAHRLVAAMAWLLNKYPEAHLKSVPTEVLRPRPPMLQALLKHAEGADAIYFAQVEKESPHRPQLTAMTRGADCTYVVRITHGSRDTFLGVSPAAGAVVEAKTSLWSKTIWSKTRQQKESLAGRFSLQQVPAPFLKAWANNGWLEASIKAAKPWVGPRSDVNLGAKEANSELADATAQVAPSPSARPRM